MIRIAIAASEHGPASVRTCDVAVVVIGRDARCDVVLATPGISATHCRLSPMPGVAGAFVLEDLGSSYGTYVNGTKVARPVVVSSRDAIALGSQSIRIVAGDGEVAAPAPEVAPERAAARVVDAWQDHYTRFDALARAWDTAGRGRTGLLRGAALADAEAWLAAGRGREPAPQPLHRDFVQACRRSASRSVLVVGAAATGVLAIAATGAWWWRHEQTSGADVPEVVDTSSETASTDDVPVAVVDDGPVRWELPALVELAAAIPDPDTRLTIQAEIARLPGSLLSDGRFGLLAGVQRELGKRRVRQLRAGDGGITALAWSPVGHTLVAGGNDDGIALWRLDAPAPSVPLLLLGHVGTITSLTIAPGGRWLVSASDDRTLRRWDLQADDPGATAAVMRGHEAPPSACAISPDGRWAVSGDGLGTLRAWDLEAPLAPESSARRDAHEGPVTDLRFEGADTVLSAGDDRMLRRWHVEPGGNLRPVTRFEGATSGLTRISIDRTGHKLAAAAADGSIALWDVGAKAAAPLQLVGHGARVNDIVVTGDGRTLVSASDDDTLRVWDLGAADPSIASIVFAGHTGDVASLHLIAGDTRVVSVALDHSVRVWDLTKKDRVVDAYTVGAHAGAIAALAIAADGSLGASGGEAGELQLWDPLARGDGITGKTLRAAAAILTDGAITADGATLLVAGGEGRAELWSPGDPASVPTPRRLRGLAGTATAVAIDRAARHAAVGNESGTILVWSLADVDAPPRSIGGHARAINRLGFVGDGARLLSAGSDGTVRISSLDDAGEPVVLRAHADEIGAMAIADDGRWAVTGSLDGGLVRWDLQAADLAAAAVTLTGHDGEIRSLAISPDGRWLASGGVDRRARLWDLAQGTTAFVLRGHDEPVTALAFGPDGKRLATGGADGQLRIWQLDAAHPDESPRSLVGHDQSVTDLVFVGPDVLASSSNDGTVRLWRIENGEALAFTGHDGPVKRLLRTPERLVSIGYDGSARLWPVAGEAVATRICETIGHSADPAALAAVFGPRAPAPGCVAALQNP